MKLFSTFLAVRIASAFVLLVLSLPTVASAQRSIGAKSLVLDDGAGNISTLVAAPGGSGTLTLPSGSGTLTLGGFTPAYFNAYTTFLPFTIAPGSEVPVSTVSVISGFVADGSGGYIVSATGVYNVEYTVTRDEPSAFAISVNGVVQPNSVFGCATGTTVVHGNALLSLTAGDDVTLIASPNNVVAVTLELFQPFYSVVASVTATRIQ
jgi:hypothetical protein